MNKYVKRPIPVYAFQWDGKIDTLRKNLDPLEIWKYFKPYQITNTDVKNGIYRLKVKTLEGIEECHKNDYIIQGIQNEFYVCNQKIFEKSYKRVK